MIRQFSNETIKKCVDTAKNFVYEIIAKIPNHTQTVERHIQIVSSASKSVIGKENRDGKICSVIRSRNELLRVETRKDYEKLMKNM